MKRCLTTTLLFALVSAVVRADVTVVQTVTMEGAAAALGGAPTSSTMTNRVKGLKGRLQIEIGPQTSTTIVDTETKQVIQLRDEDKTARVLADGSTPVDVPVGVKVDASSKPSGKSQTINGVKCDEYLFTATMNLSEVSGGSMPPEMAAMAKDLTLGMTGSVWAAKEAPGAAEFVAFQKALAKADPGGVMVGGGKIPGLDKVLKSMTGVDGIAYLVEVNVAIAGTGQMADLLRQTGLGAMKITMKTTSVSVDPLSDELFKIPEGYTVRK